MAINFPVPTVLNQEHTDIATGIVYIWVGTVSPVAGFWQVKSAPGSGSTPTPGGGNASIYVGDTPPTTPGENQLWWNSSNGRLYIYYDDSNTIQWVEASPGIVTPDALPVGSILPIASMNVPAGFIECDGRAINRITYSDLFAEIGTVWGIGDGVNTFNVPDLRGEFLRGWDHGRFVDNVGSYDVTKTTGTNVLTGVGSIPYDKIENGMLVVGTGIPNGTTIQSFAVTANVVQSITLSQVVTGSGSVRINIFGRKFGTEELDAIQNIVGRIMTQSANSGPTGAFKLGTNVDGGFNGAGQPTDELLFDASGSVRTTDNETRPRNQAVMYVIKAFATVTNPGLIDVADLANDVMALQNQRWISSFISWNYPTDVLIKFTIPHGLGYKPRTVVPYLRCKNAIGAYSVGDYVPIYTVYQPASIYGMQLKWDAVNIVYKIHNNGLLVPDMDGAWNAEHSGAAVSANFDIFFIADK